MDAGDGLAEPLILLSPTTQGRRCLAIKSTRRDIQQPTHQPQGKHSATTLNHGIPYRFGETSSSGSPHLQACPLVIQEDVLQGLYIPLVVKQGF